MVLVALVGSASDYSKRGLWKVMAALFKRITRSELVYRRLKANDHREVYAGLLWVAKTKGYKTGWAAYKFKEIMGNWPQLGQVDAQQPTSDLLTWIERGRRNYGARMKREEAKRADQFSQ